MVKTEFLPHWWYNIKCRRPDLDNRWYIYWETEGGEYLVQSKNKLQEA